MVLGECTLDCTAEFSASAQSRWSAEKFPQLTRQHRRELRRRDAKRIAMIVRGRLS